MFITILNVFVTVNELFAFSSGIDINRNVVAYARGVSLVDLMAGTSLSESSNLELLIFLLFVLLFALLILNVFYYSNVKKNNRQVIRKIQVVLTILYLGALAIFGVIFSDGTKKVDHKYIRIYGAGLFSLLGFVSFLIIGCLQIYWTLKTLSSDRTETPQGQIPKTTPQRQTGMILIIIYQILIGFSLIATAWFLYMISNLCISFGALGGCQNFHPATGQQVIAFLIFLWALLGIISAFLLLSWNYYGYIGSWIFLITTGIILSPVYLISFVCMIISLYYYLFNKEFKESIKFIKSQRYSPQNT